MDAKIWPYQSKRYSRYCNASSARSFSKACSGRQGSRAGGTCSTVSGARSAASLLRDRKPSVDSRGGRKDDLSRCPEPNLVSRVYHASRDGVQLDAEIASSALQCDEIMSRR